MKLESRLVRPLSRAFKRTVRTSRKFLVLSTLSTISLAACQDGSDVLTSDSADPDRQIVFRHFV